MIKSENLGGNSGVKKRPWAVKPFKSDIVCSAYVGSSVAGPSEKPRQEYTYFFFCIMSALPPSVCYICIKLLPGTPAWNICKQPPLLKEQFPSRQRPSVPFPSHTQRCLACSTRVSSLSCTWFLFGCWHSELLLAALAPGLCTSKLVLMSSQHKHKYVRNRCMG